MKASASIILGQTYEFRLVDSDRSIVGAAVAQLVAASQPEMALSPGQRDGVPRRSPVDAAPTPVSVMDAPQVTAATIGATWPETSATPRYRLAIALPTAPAIQHPLNAGSFTSPHTPDGSLVSDTCAICHRAHVAQEPVAADVRVSAELALLHLSRRQELRLQPEHAGAVSGRHPREQCGDRRRHAQRVLPP